MDPVAIGRQHGKANRAVVERSTLCGCYCCLKHFRPDMIIEWGTGEETAVCPFCDTDSVIGDASGLDPDNALLRVLHDCWFGFR